ncbi:MAG: division/cell wall cluster transcriptional repressor MraZ [Desulfobacteraceae bacterium]|nr:division/cell wall cluster transcriptional repressor MraZ [Desulfobacteraceae bacterium]
MEFRGTSPHTLDDKGRLIIPARFRTALQAGGGDDLMLTRWEKSLRGYSMQAWGKFEDKIKAMTSMSEGFHNFIRLVVGSAQVCTCDKQGRVLIPLELRDFAKLGKDIRLLGMIDHFEIWSLEGWAKEAEQVELDLQKPEVRNDIIRLGL